MRIFTHSASSSQTEADWTLNLCAEGAEDTSPAAPFRLKSNQVLTGNLNNYLWTRGAGPEAQNVCAAL